MSMVTDPNESPNEWETDYQDEHYNNEDDDYEEEIDVGELDYSYYVEQDEFEQEMKDLLDKYEDNKNEYNSENY